MGFLRCDLRVTFQFHQLSCTFPIIFLSFSAAGSSPRYIGFRCEGKSLIAKDSWVISSYTWCMVFSGTHIFSKHCSFLCLVTVTKDWKFTVLRLIFYIFFKKKNQVLGWILVLYCKIQIAKTLQYFEHMNDHIKQDRSFSTPPFCVWWQSIAKP